MIKMIAAVSKNGVIGKDNKLPFDYPADMKFFRKMTANSTVVMGRKTWESIGRPLPKRRNIVISRNKINVDGLETFASLEHALISACESELADDSPPAPDAWLIGGSSIYRDGMQFVNDIYLTLIPETVVGDNLTFFPWVDPTKFQVAETISLEDSELKALHYVRK